MAGPSSKPRPSKPCRFFNSRNGCRDGANCKFSHPSEETKETRTLPSTAQQKAAPTPAQSKLDEQLQQWIYLLPRPKNLHTYEVRAKDTRKLFNSGWERVAMGNFGVAQQVISKMATESGLKMIKAVADWLEESAPDEVPFTVYKDNLLPLFRILSHPMVQSSLILETPLNQIFNLLYGPNGRRFVTVFQYTATSISHLLAEGDNEEYCVALISTLRVLHSICDLHQKAQILDELPSLVETLEACVPSEQLYHEARQILLKIKRRLRLGGLAHLPTSPAQTAVSKNKRPHAYEAKFKFQTDLPGQLSDQGPRHDNDHESIRDIKILPTAEEILSTRQEYLPSNDPSESHLPGLEGLLDRQFRLLREDQIGPLRDAVRNEIQRLTHTGLPNPRDQAARTIGHGNATLLGWEVDRRKGLQMIAEFDQPVAIKAKQDPKQREQAWTESKQLQIDALVCLVAASGKIVFLTVCDPTPTPPPARRQDRGDESEPDDAIDQETEIYLRRKKNMPSLSMNRDRAAIALSMIEYDEDDVTWINNQLHRSPQIMQALVEFPGILLPSFQPVLQALQSMSENLDLPFSEWIAPEDPRSHSSVLDPPAYAQRRGFAYDLTAVAPDADLEFTPGQYFDHNALQAQTTLDPAQQASVLHALSSELALIQGPPGTGKSYTGICLVKTLLDSCSSIDSGPILIVCYTNHALDQFLESLVKSQVEQIIRLGRRSQSEVLEKFSLHHLTREMEQTRIEGQTRWELRKSFDAAIVRVGRLLPQLNNITSAASVKEYLKENYYQHYKELYESTVEDEGFQVVREKGSDRLRSWLRGSLNGVLPGPPPEHPQLLKYTSRPLQSLTSNQRQALYNQWITELAEDLNQKLLDALESYNDARTALSKCNQERDLRCLLQSKIIGCTTTDLARNLDVLRRVRTKIVVVEEAGEVLEAHTLAALLPSVEHAILIGDHEQLRPQINNYELQHDHPRGERYALDVSLFERFVRPKHRAPELPYSSLKTQRRMHPSISELIRSTLYPQLEDHECVKSHPEVVGMRDRLYWLDHDEKEDKATPGAVAAYSKSNAFEVEMVAALVSHLTRQGIYASEDIAVLTPYLGQLRKIKQRLGSTFEIVIGDKDDEAMEAHGLKETMTATQITHARKSTLLKALRLATVDNFQGEEAKVIVVSLVRSNDERKCGFLKTSNRINVLLSRAKNGMYIIGNSYTASSVKMWADVIRILENKNQIGTSLALCCPRHPETAIKVRTPDDFALLAPEGGCNRKCKLRLECGHACVNQCHATPLHEAVVCLERCPRIKQGCQHPCQRPCGEPCDKRCKDIVPGITLPCGHTPRTLECHQAQFPEAVKCMANVEVTVPSCDHKTSVRCSNLPLPEDFSCTVTCGTVLKCGHGCKRKCNTCSTVKDGTLLATYHGDCAAICGRNFTTCHHSCKRRCHDGEPCSPCEEPCEVRCSHSQCSKKCSEPCAPCAEDCSWVCPHRGRCQMACAVPCDMLPCSKRCEKTLSCLHQCPSLCGEECPDARFCQQCAEDSIKGTIVDYIMQSTYADVDLDENPIIVPPCRHLITVESMDGYMGMQQFFEFSPPDSIHVKALRSTSKPFEAADLKGCPLCRMPLRNINRYGRIVKRAFVDEATKKFIVWANSSFVPLAKQLVELEERLASTFKDHEAIARPPAGPITKESVVLKGDVKFQVARIKGIIGQQNKYKDLFSLRQHIQGFHKKVGETEQPFRRVYDLVMDTRLNRGTETDFDFVPEMLQTRNRLLATALLLRCDYLILLEFLTMCKEGRAVQALGSAPILEINFTNNRDTSYKLIGDSINQKQWATVVEGQLYWARFAALERGISQANEYTAGLLKDARNHMTNARFLCSEYPGQTKGMLAEVEGVERMLNDGTFYAPVSNEEKAAVYAAMASEFSGTGHWYYCENGHPFTVGECGMPMQTSVCPQCGSPVGGSDHRSVGGVRRAEDLEGQFGRMAI